MKVYELTIIYILALVFILALFGVAMWAIVESING